jgi:hypothetical protein
MAANGFSPATRVFEAAGRRRLPHYRRLGGNRALPRPRRGGAVARDGAAVAEIAATLKRASGPRDRPSGAGSPSSPHTYDRRAAGSRRPPRVARADASRVTPIVGNHRPRPCGARAIFPRRGSRRRFGPGDDCPSVFLVQILRSRLWRRRTGRVSPRSSDEEQRRLPVSPGLRPGRRPPCRRRPLAAAARRRTKRGNGETPRRCARARPASPRVQRAQAVHPSFELNARHWRATRHSQG